MIVVGLTGFKGAGKDSVADIMVRDYGFTKLAFAEPLKAMLRRLDPIIGHDLYAGCCAECSDQPEVTEVRLSDALKFGFDDQSIKHSPWAEEVRDLWERLGTEVFRQEDDFFWVEQAWGAMHEAMINTDRVVFTDVRFENEAEMIQIAGTQEGWQSSLWRIARPGTFGGEHPAEQMAGLLGEEVTILNDGTLDDLNIPVDLAFSKLTAGELPGQLAFNFGEAND